MITSIIISRVASYGDDPSEMNGLSSFNYIYGANGSGKTTISRVINNQQAHPTCNLKWSSDDHEEILVYNQDFVEKNFNQSSALKGVFTLGEDSVAAEKQIEECKAELQRIQNKINGLNEQLGSVENQSGKHNELEALESSFREECFEVKRLYDDVFQEAFRGNRSDAKKFKAKVLEEAANNQSPLLELNELKEKAETVFSASPERAQALPVFDFTEIIGFESDPILKTKVIGREDVDIAGLIEKLDSSDWVKKGMSYLDHSDGDCPFCQRRIQDDFRAKIGDYFNESYERDLKSIDSLLNRYVKASSELESRFANILSLKSSYLDVDLFRAEAEVFKSTCSNNQELLRQKKKEPSREFELHTLQECTTTISQLLKDANEKIRERNRLVDNIKNEKTDLIDLVWKYLLENDLKAPVQRYKSGREPLVSVISGMEKSLEEQRKYREKKGNEIKELEKRVTSIQPTINEINRLLKDFGFTNFAVSQSKDGKGYRLERSDGSEAMNTLSEGEKTFITFLYFYQSLKGSSSESGISNDRLAVFDDPISSLDSDILFIVSSLIKGLIEQVRQGLGYIKQVFVLTHNIYFFKEVTFNPNRPAKVSMNEETFWVVRKSGQHSTIEAHDSNPIRTSYELLWAEVRNQDRNNLSIQNTLRRILENYFKILGNTSFEAICEKFKGKQRLICKSLFSWVHDGSHNAMDDLYVTATETQVEGYLEVFENIFRKTGHGAHYDMMMNGSKTKESQS